MNAVATYRVIAARHVRVSTIVGLLTVAAFAFVLWIVALRDVDVRAMNDLGLVSVFPRGMFLCLALLTLGFFWALYSRGLPTIVLFLYVGLLLLVLYGTPSAVEETPRFEATWRHAGFIEFISRTGTVD